MFFLLLYSRHQSKPGKLCGRCTSTEPNLTLSGTSNCLLFIALWLDRLRTNGHLSSVAERCLEMYLPTSPWKTCSWNWCMSKHYLDVENCTESVQPREYRYPSRSYQCQLPWCLDALDCQRHTSYCDCDYVNFPSFTDFPLTLFVTDSDDCFACLTCVLLMIKEKSSAPRLSTSSAHRP